MKHLKTHFYFVAFLSKHSQQNFECPEDKVEFCMSLKKNPNNKTISCTAVPFEEEFSKIKSIGNSLDPEVLRGVGVVKHSQIPKKNCKQESSDEEDVTYSRAEIQTAVTDTPLPSTSKGSKYKMACTGNCSNLSVNHVITFDGTNLPLWRLGLNVALEEAGVQFVTDGTDPVPSEEREVIPDTNEEEEDTYGDEILNADEKNEWKGNSCSPHLPVHNRQKIADHTHSEMQNRE
ncbi:hypothetical protein DAPPUDRAFT_321593 [Daphnia pulex]|uniref:Uncharacterized protein n=1 Tax=Daphnia pulex TaxID=6669 RepID=E9GT42_DAPPU|nr:hypothetical protein DAPPUDRAFT_321593 [Daphnia pulex]|eukprot:EFX77338.1 hypothetical protein DAPPUDRAFT_321593 [Daphnia pulex]